MMSLKNYAYSAATGINIGLQQELKLQNKYHYLLEVRPSSRVVVIMLHHINPHYLSQISGMTKQLSMWAGLDDKHNVRIGWQGRKILIEVPLLPKYWKKITIDEMEQNHLIRRGLIATLGLGLQNDPKRINFQSANMAHVFITGQTRSGKTNTERLIGWNLVRNTTPDQAQMVIFDVVKRGANWGDFEKVANLAHPIVTNLNEADRVLSWANQEIERRAEAWRGISIERRTSMPKIFLMIDELKALIDDSSVASGYLNRLASVGGEFGLHLILSTQYPQSSILGKDSAELKRNVTTRLCGRVDDWRAANEALGVTGSGAETLQGYGDFLLKDGDGLSRLTVAKVETNHIAALPRGEQHYLDLPDSDIVNSGAPSAPVRQPDPVEPEQVALALFKPTGINKLQKELGIGGGKATRVKDFADKVKNWATDNGYRIDDNNGWLEFEYYDPLPY